MNTQTNNTNTHVAARATMARIAMRQFGRNNDLFKAFYELAGLGNLPLPGVR